MLRSPIHREIDQSITLGGLEPDDLVVLAVIGYLVGVLTSSIHIGIGPVDVTLLVSLGAIAAAFSMWLFFRHGRPRHYLRDLLRMASEPDVWVVTPDLLARPLFGGE